VAILYTTKSSRMGKMVARSIRGKEEQLKNQLLLSQQRVEVNPFDEQIQHAESELRKQHRVFEHYKGRGARIRGWM
jgi:hypothetical protein